MCVVCVGWDLRVLVRASVFLYLSESSLQMKKMHRVGKPRGGKDGRGPTGPLFSHRPSPSPVVSLGCVFLTLPGVTWAFSG